MKLNVVYEDNHLLVVLKPTNLLCQGDKTGDVTIVDLAKNYLKEKYQKPGNVYVGLVHRLDRPVSGLLLLAKTSKAAERLSLALNKKEIKRYYFAIAEGNIPSCTLTHYLNQNKDGFIVQANETMPSAQFAQLSTISVAQKDGTTLCFIELFTGRKHQIRAQFAISGHPLLYDMRYGHGILGNQIALFGAVLTFVHPVTKKNMFFSAYPTTPSFNLYKQDIQKFLTHLGEEYEKNFS